jgi:hypothetical protein
LTHRPWCDEVELKLQSSGSGSKAIHPDTRVAICSLEAMKADDRDSVLLEAPGVQLSVV